MISLRKSAERHHVRRVHREEWSSFHAGRAQDGFSLGFGALKRIDQHRLESSASVLVRPGREVEVVSYVLDGVVACRDAARRTAILRAGDFQRVSGGDLGGLRQTNAARGQVASIMQLWIGHDGEQHARSPEQRRFSAAERRGVLRLVASANGSDQGLHLAVDIRMYSALLEPGQHLVHELAFRRSAWLQVLRGELSCDDALLQGGDAASFALERAVAVTARAPSEILLLELPHLASATRVARGPSE